MAAPPKKVVKKLKQDRYAHAAVKRRYLASTLAAHLTHGCAVTTAAVVLNCTERSNSPKSSVETYNSQLNYSIVTTRAGVLESNGDACRCHVTAAGKFLRQYFTNYATKLLTCQQRIKCVLIICMVWFLCSRIICRRLSRCA